MSDWMDFLAEAIARRCAPQRQPQSSLRLDEAMTAVLSEYRIMVCDRQLWLRLRETAQERLTQIGFAEQREQVPVAGQE